MIAILFFVAIACFVALLIAYDKRRRSGVGRILTGTVQAHRLTFGMQGQQILTIDGISYNVWLKYEEFDQVERGNVITHRPYWNTTFGRKLLSTEIIAVEKKKNKDAASTESTGQVPS